MSSHSHGLGRRALAMGLAIVLLAGACTSSGDDAAEPTTTSAATPTSAASTNTTATQPPRSSGDPQEIDAALLAGQDVRPGPYVYAEGAPICNSGCDTSVIDIYYTPDPDDTTRRRAVEAWRDDVSFDPSAEVWISDPLHIGEELLSAVEQGKDVTWEVDAATGLIVSWTVDGSGLAYNCLSVDTAPLESRDRECGGRVYQR